MDSSLEKVTDFVSKNKLLSGLVVTIVIILLYLNLKTRNLHRNVYEDYLYGNWIADDGFCDESDISSMMMFIGEPVDKKSSNVKRKAYLIINNDITNQTIDISYKKQSTGNDLTLKQYKFPVKIDFSDPDVDIPDNVNFEIDIQKGRLRIHDDEVVYGVLYKNHEISEVLKD